MSTPAVDLTRDLKELASLRRARGRDRRPPAPRARLARARGCPTTSRRCSFWKAARSSRGRPGGGSRATSVRRHELALADFPTLREALETRRARAFTEDDHSHGDGDPFDGVLDLPHGHSCMVVPLCAGRRSFGVLTLDRAVCEPYPAEVVEPGGGLRPAPGPRHPERRGAAPPSSACTARTTSTPSCSRPSWHGERRRRSRRAGAPAMREAGAPSAAGGGDGHARADPGRDRHRQGAAGRARSTTGAAAPSSPSSR